MSLELWIPPSARERRRVIVCELCKRRFPAEQEQQAHRHIKACLKRNIDVLQEHVHRREQFHGDDLFDLEFEAYLRREAAKPR